MSLVNFLEFINYLLTFIVPAYGGAQAYIHRAEKYDQGILKPKYVNELNIELDLQAAAAQNKNLNKGVAGFCIHDMDNIGPGSDFYDKLIETYGYPEAGFAGTRPQIRYEIDFSIIYDCDSFKLRPGNIDILNYHADKAFEMGYEPRFWLVKVPECLESPFYDNLDLGILSSERPPADAGQWENLMKELARTFTLGRTAAGKRPVTHYELRGEIDLPNSFSGSFSEFDEYILQPTARALQSVENEAGYELELAMGSNSNGVGAFNTRHQRWQLNSATRNNFELEYVNWHEYGHYPFAAGDEALDIPFLTDTYFGPLARTNPWATSKQHYFEASEQRSLFPGKKYMIGEWNYAGFEEYAGTVYSGAYMCGSLIEMEQAGVDIATSFLFKGFSPQSTCSVTNTDTITPQGYALKFFHDLASQKIPVQNYSPGDTSNDISVIAARDPQRITLIVSRFFGAPDPRNTMATITLPDIASYLASPANRYLVRYTTIRGQTPLGTTEQDSAVLSPEGGTISISRELEPNSYQFIEIVDGSNITSVTRNSLAGKISFYPNPASNQFTVFNQTGQLLRLEILTLQGQVVLQQPAISENYRQDLGNMIPSGTYWIRFSNGREDFSAPLVIIR